MEKEKNAPTKKETAKKTSKIQVSLLLNDFP